MPGEDGLSFIRELAADDATRELPVVVLSARAEQGRQELAGAAIGVLDWLSKPIDQQRLSSAVRAATQRTEPKILYVEDDPDLSNGLSRNNCLILRGAAMMAAWSMRAL